MTTDLYRFSQSQHANVGSSGELGRQEQVKPHWPIPVACLQESGKPASYTPNQTIGSLEGRIVHIVTKDVSSQKSVNRASKKEKPFEVTMIS